MDTGGGSNISTSLGAVSLVERNVAPDGLQLVCPKNVTRKSPDDLVLLAQELQKADEFVRATTSGKLSVIVEQVRHLQDMARRILEEARDSTRLNHAACNFRKVPGKTYHLYERSSGQAYFSMLSPQEWGASSPPQKYLGSYRLEYDMTWTPLEKVEDRDSQMQIVERLLDTRRFDMILDKSADS